MSFYDKIKVSWEDFDYIWKHKYLGLNDFESDFMASIKEFCFFRGYYHLSKKQKNVFDKILAKAKAAEKYREIFERFRL